MLHPFRQQTEEVTRTFIVPASPSAVVAMADGARPVQHGSACRLETGIAPLCRFWFDGNADGRDDACLFPVVATQYAHLREAQAGIAASAASIAILIGGHLFGWFADRGNRNLVLSLQSFANAGSCILYMLFPYFTGFLTGRTLDDMGKAAFRPAWSSMLVEISEHDEKTRAQTMAILDTTSDVGEILGPILAGLLISAFAIPGMLAVRIVLALVTEAQAYMLFRKIE